MQKNWAIYGRYKKMRDAVWQVLSDYKISQLPVNVTKICHAMEITVMSYREGADLINSLEIENECAERKALALQINDKWHILYDSQLIPRSLIKFYLAHELGHILLGHEMETKNIEHRQIKFSKRNPIQTMEDIFEKEADQFAVRLLAPAGVIAALNIHEAADIEYLSFLPPEYAADRARRMQELYKRNEKLYKGGVYGMSKLELEVIDNFKEFIADYLIARY